MHPDTLGSVRNLAILLEVKGSVTEARASHSSCGVGAVLLGGDVDVGSGG